MVVDFSHRGAQWGGVSLKQITLITLTVQNSALILIMHYSRIMPPVNGERYFPSTAVFLNEVLKLGISLTMTLYDVSSRLPHSAPVTQLLVQVSDAVFSGDSWKLAIPALLYTLQNTLQYVAASNLDAAIIQVTYQLKILTTALFSIALLGRSLSTRKWVSLVLLMLGVAMVQLPGAQEPADLASLRAAHTRLFVPRTMEQLRDMGSSAAAQLVRRAPNFNSRVVKRSATYEGIEEDVAMQNPQLNASLGLIAVIMSCLLSGLAGVYFEKVLKDSSAKTSVWTRNVQLSFYSLFPSLFLGVIFKDGEEISKTGFFTGYNWVVWMAIACQAFGGVMVALVVNYSDNIAKNFATSISIILSFVVSIWFFNFKVHARFIFGTAIVLLATYLYGSHERRGVPPIRIANYEKTTIGGDPGYFDAEAAGGSLSVKSPLKGGEGRSTSRPGTPTVERHHFRLGSERRQLGRREA